MTAVPSVPDLLLVSTGSSSVAFQCLINSAEEKCQIVYSDGKWVESKLIVGDDERNVSRSGGVGWSTVIDHDRVSSENCENNMYIVYVICHRAAAELLIANNRVLGQ